MNTTTVKQHTAVITDVQELKDAFNLRAAKLIEANTKGRKTSSDATYRFGMEINGRPARAFLENIGENPDGTPAATATATLDRFGRTYDVGLTMTTAGWEAKIVTN